MVSPSPRWCIFPPPDGSWSLLPFCPGQTRTAILVPKTETMWNPCTTLCDVGLGLEHFVPGIPVFPPPPSLCLFFWPLPALSLLLCHFCLGYLLSRYLKFKGCKLFNLAMCLLHTNTYRIKICSDGFVHMQRESIWKVSVFCVYVCAWISKCVYDMNQDQPGGGVTSH